MGSTSWAARWFLSCLVAGGVLAGIAAGTPAGTPAGAPGGSSPMAVPARAPAAAPAAPDQAYEAVDAFLREQIDVLGIPGAALAVVRDGVQVHSAAFGRADDSGRAMTAQTPVLLASTSKSLTAIAVMQQVEAGRLQLDEPVRTYLPWFTLKDNRSASITVRHLLHQSSGMASGDTAFEASDAEGPEAIEEGVRALSDSPLAGEPGEAFRYASANFNVLGLLVQTVSGQPFGAYMEQHVFGPLGMAHSHPTRAAAREDNMASGYSLWFGAFWRQTDVPAPSTGMPSTTMYASAEDLGHELVALLGEGRYGDRSLLQPESVHALLTPRVRVDGSKEYAMGWFTRPLSESADGDVAVPRVLEHQGEWGNTHTFKAMVPASGLGVALVVNANDTSAPSRLKALDSNVLRILHGQPPAPTVVQEDWLQRHSWVVSLALLLAELLSLALALTVLFRKRAPVRKRAPARKRWFLLAYAVTALALDAFALWLCLIYAPSRFETNLAVIVRQFPDVGISLVPVLVLALIWPLPRTVLLLAGLFTSRPAPGRRQSTSRA
ncbi:serine hydrolase [Arthrobacter sp. Y81]|uniref:serine hydrolase domain-containing protein n=1 Tax=Arthrobacter sp. Y81 TaxID=2058897 RepID=UPI000CE32D3A|nr:serine hydrolase domain-containing protein [Arthrobacter sp. Y81]